MEGALSLTYIHARRGYFVPRSNNSYVGPELSHTSEGLVLGSVRKQVSPPRDVTDQLLEGGDHLFFPVLDFELAVVGCASRRLDEDVPELQDRQTAKNAWENINIWP